MSPAFRVVHDWIYYYNGIIPKSERSRQEEYLKQQVPSQVILPNGRVAFGRPMASVDDLTTLFDQAKAKEQGTTSQDSGMFIM